MDFLRLTILMTLLAYGAVAIDYARESIRVQASAITPAELTKEDSIYIKHLAGLASVWPVSILVKDGMLLGTGLDRQDQVCDPTAHAETEAIRDACRRAKTSVLKDGVLYASRMPCAMCMGIIARAGISKVCFPSSTASRDSSVFFIIIPKSVN